MNVLWLIPIIVGIFGLLCVGMVYLYTGWRMRLHQKGILDIRHDGRNAKPGEPRTIFEFIRLEKEFDAKKKDQG